jgi:sugar fermentation stimulation protein A
MRLTGGFQRAINLDRTVIMNPAQAYDLHWPPLIRGRLIRRYKRFLADVRLDDGTTVTAHCPNSGSMLGCCQPGRPVYLSLHDNPARKLKYTWELIEMPTSLVGVNTLIPNRLVADAVRRGRIPELAGYTDVVAEVKIDAHTRLDAKASGNNLKDCYIEVKNCTLVEEGHAMFPDARTARGEKHLRTLDNLRRGGFRAVLFFVVQRSDAEYFTPAEHIDPAYARTLHKVAAAGVEILVYEAIPDTVGIALHRPLGLRLTPRWS